MKWLFWISIILLNLSEFSFAEEISAVKSRWDSERESTAAQFAKLIYYDPESERCKTKDQNPGSLDSLAQCPTMIWSEMKPKIDLEINDCRKHKKEKKYILKCNANLTRLVQASDAQMHLRYKFTNWEEVDLKCKADESNVCQNIHVIELFAMLSNNQHVIAAETEALEKQHQGHVTEIRSLLPQTQIPTPRQTTSQSFLRVVGTILQGMGDGLARSSSVYCTTNIVGNTAYTDCH